MARIDEVRVKLTASLDGEGKPLKGYTARVAACRAELRRLEDLEIQRATITIESEEGHGG